VRKRSRERGQEEQRGLLGRKGLAAAKGTCEETDRKVVDRPQAANTTCPADRVLEKVGWDDEDEAFVALLVGWPTRYSSSIPSARTVFVSTTTGCPQRSTTKTPRRSSPTWAALAGLSSP
jgi:hypothetical protein